MMLTWFITGASRGLGRALAVAALEAGDRVAATARSTAALDDLVTTHGDRVVALQLDVTDPAAARAALEAAVARFGRVDVVVNNAGYGDLSPIETTPDAVFRAQVDTNFWGVVHVSRAAIPVLRAQGGGRILQISSMGGRTGSAPGFGPYGAAKFAVDGFSHSLSAEVEPFGVRVTVVEPSGMATDWARSSMTVHAISEDYADTVGLMDSRLHGKPGPPDGVPERAADVLVRLAHSEQAPTHLLLGGNAVRAAIATSQSQIAEAERWAEVSRSIDRDSAFPVALPATQL